MNPLAEELNATIKSASPSMYSVLSGLGRQLFFPKGILTQTAEAREKADRYNATIGIARQGGHAMNLPVIMDMVPGLSSDEALDYAPSTGNAALRRRWLDDMFVKNPSLAGKEVSLPIVTSGITHGLTVAGEMFVDPGDAVLVTNKFWGNYNMVFGVRRGADVRRFPLFVDGGASFDVGGMAATLGAALDEKGKALVLLNFPNNPTGYSIRRSEAGEVVDAICSAAGPGREVVVVLDDAYFGLFYDDECLAESLFGLLADRSEHVFPVKLDGVTKEEYAWGLRVGFITFSAVAGGKEKDLYSALEKKAGGTIRGNISNCSQLSQSVVLAAMDAPGFAEQKKDKFELMRARARKVMDVLEKPDYSRVWEPYPFNAGYFMCVRLKDVDAEAFRVRLLERYGVGVIAEGTDIRIAFSCLETEEIPDLFDIMYRCATEMTDQP
ncbi:MAG TPA: aminotransferase class I/II-fold pyridoxal phosphate-dependent enzyme [Candidatus Anoxymicrobiaceae bacterium]